MTHLAIQLFGSLQVTLDGKPVDGFASDKVRALLAYLVMSPDQPQRREKLAGLLWPEFPERSARTSLRNSLANLRKVIGDQYTLPPFLHITRQTIQFNQNSDHWLDVDACTSLLAASQPEFEALQEAASLYRGEFLEGFFIADSIPFEDWSLVKREHYQRQVLEALQRIIEICELQGIYEGGLPYAWRLVEIEPWEEAGQRALMRLLALSDRRSEALMQFEKSCQVLSDELGIEPSAETTELYEDIRSGEFVKSIVSETDRTMKAGLPLPSSLSAPIVNLPSIPTPFIGREDELAALDEILADANVRLVTIIGPGGIGKTRLAIQTAEEMLAGGGMLFRDGVYFVSLETVYDTDAIVSAVAGALGFQFYEEGVNAQGQVVDYLRGKRLLLVLDNFEQLIGESSAELLAEMLHASPGLKILITSRERLNQPGEQVYSVGGMHIPDIDNLDWEGQAIENGFEYSGVTLFLQTARRSQVDFIPDKQEMIAIMEICHLVKGMPLGIELAAAWVSVLRPRAFLEEIRASLDILETNMHSIPARQRSLRAVFDASWKQLSEDERYAVMRLSVFRGDFTRQSAAQVADVSIKVLLNLVNKSWIQTMPDERYNFHPVVHFYASEAADGQLETIKQRHAECFCSFISERKDELYGQRQNETLIEMEAEISNQKDAWKTAIELERFDLIDQATHGYCTYFDLRSRFEEGAHACATAVDALERAQYADSSAPGKPKPGSCLLVKLLTWSAHFTLDYQKQSRMIDRAQALLEEPEFHDKECQSTQARLWHIHGQHIAWEDRVRGGEYFQRSMELASKLGDRYLQALAMASLGWASWVTGDVDWAKKQFQMSLDIRREIGDQRGIAYLGAGPRQIG